MGLSSISSRRAVISADINIVEGYALNTPLLFRRHVRISLGSAAEAERLIQIAQEMAYLSGDSTELLARKADRLQKLLAGLLRSPRLLPDTTGN